MPPVCTACCWRRIRRPFGRAYYTALGNFKDALKEIHLARDVDPLSLRFADRFLYMLVFFKDYNRAIAEAQTMLARNPDFVMGYAWKAMALTMKGRFPEALEAPWTQSPPRGCLHHTRAGMCCTIATGSSLHRFGQHWQAAA